MRPRLASILSTVEQVGVPLGAVGPLDEQHLSGVLASEIRPSLKPELIRLLTCSNDQARAVTLHAIRFARYWSDDALTTSVVERLEDESARVRAAAVAALAASGLATAEVREGLRRVAQDADARETLDLDDYAQRARVEAAKVLARLALK